MTIKELLEETVRALKSSGAENAEGEARQLVCHILSCSLSYLIAHGDEWVDEKILLGGAALIKERMDGRPLQYILGSSSFCGITLAVDERVLIPRPETELLVQKALEYVSSGTRVLDLCTGSGCIAAAAAEAEPGAVITAADLSPRACMLAAVNLRPWKNVKTVRGDLFENTPGPYDVIITNPPYIPSGEIEKLEREVKDHEPVSALDGGSDGLDIIRRIIAEAPQHLSPEGVLLMEIGEDQGDAVKDLAAKEFGSVCIQKDLSQKDRIAIMRLPK